MAFPVKDWKNLPDESTPINATAIEDLETRLSGYTDTRVNPVESGATDLAAAAAINMPPLVALGAETTP